MTTEILPKKSLITEADDENGDDDDNESESFDNSVWTYMPQSLILKIFTYLEVHDMINMSYCCRRWYSASRDDWIWRKYFHRDFGLPVNRKLGLKPDGGDWYSEYKRLTYNVPMVLTDVLCAHSHQVLHVSFSHNGKLFCTTSKDGYVFVWNAGYPSNKKYSYDMKTLCWKYTQFSQFNSTDTLLLVSGVHFGVHNSTSGEIAVFSLDGDLRLKCRIVNRPYDIFGTWFTDRYLLSGDLHWLQHLISTSIVWINKASQEISSENSPIMTRLCKFYNRNASSVRSIMVANCPWLADESLIAEHEQEARPQRDRKNDLCDFLSDEYCAGNPISQAVLEQLPGPSNVLAADIPELGGAEQYWDDFPYASTFQYSEEFRRRFTTGNVQIKQQSAQDSDSTLTDEENDKSLVSSKKVDKMPEVTGETSKVSVDQEVTKINIEPNEQPGVFQNVQDIVHDESVTAKECEKTINKSDSDAETSDVDDLENAPPKYLIFSTGSKAYVPHQIGFKRIDKVAFPKQLDPGPSLKERIALRNMRREFENFVEDPDWSNWDEVSDRFDKIDKIIDLHGQIIGMALSPDHRYLYVNCRPWPQNYVIRNPLEPPPIAQEIDIHVIDLLSFKKVGKMLRAHKAYTPNTDCFFIFLDVCDNYVASGAEDMHAYLWDRYYGVCLAKYNHSDVVNSVAFNPRDNEMLVTTSDDYEIKIWRSIAKVKEMNITPQGRATQFKPKTRLT